MHEQAGVRFEKLVAGALRRLGVAHRHVERLSRIDVEDMVDIQVWRESDSRLFEIQVTLFSGNTRKIAEFARVTIARADRGICVYVDVEAPRIRFLEKIASRTAETIREIVNTFQDFGLYDLIGVRVSTENETREIFWPHTFLNRTQLNNALWACGKARATAAEEEMAHTVTPPTEITAPITTPLLPQRTPAHWAISPPQPNMIRGRDHRIHERHVAPKGHRPYFALRSAA